MAKISYYKRNGDKLIESVERTNTPENWSVRGRNATEMVLIDEEKPLYAQRRDIRKLLRYQSNKR